MTVDRLDIKLDETIRISILGYNGDGSFLWDGTRVDLTVENGSLDQLMVELADGAAEVTATANGERGEMKITARSGNTMAEPNPLVINVGTIQDVNQVITSLNPPILPYTGGRIEIIVTLYDEYLQPIPGVTVILEADAGTLDSGGTPLTSNQAGQVSDHLETDRDSIVTIYAGQEIRTVTIRLEEEPVPNQLPTADFIYSPVNPVSDEIVYFNASASSDNDGNIRNYNWDFGDGSSGGGKKPTHVYDITPFNSRTY
ncbi:MAG: hypothetical protein GY940_31295, partial [bacterium]|nr:hypothetical protein [bacterium]